jgi:hypothetical protein
MVISSAHVAVAANIALTAKQIILLTLILIPFRLAKDRRSSEFLTEENEGNKGNKELRVAK